MSDVLTTTTTTAPPDEARLKVLEGLELTGQVNTDDETLRAHIAASIRRGHPQVRREPMKPDRICLVGSGPSLKETEGELVQLLREGAKLVTVNGAYHWALEHNLQPQVQIVMDARETNARFVSPEIPRCKYVCASTCHPALWDALAGRPEVWIWHPVLRADPAAAILDAYYLKAWEGVAGGTTVTTRALFLLRMLGFLRFDLFGIDSCWMGAQHHAFPQPENAGDKRYSIRVSPSGHPELGRVFGCTGWHLMQLQDFLRVIRLNGDAFLLNVHGDGLLAYTLRVNADLADAEITEQKEGA